ncbi:hypothetical protein F2P56_009885 [Juglans regia]|nr:hypothetical protein F2P56_009885 [Juglans regia]
MVQFHLHHHRWRKGEKNIEEDEESQLQALIIECGSTSCYYKRTRPKLLSLLFLLIFSFHLFSCGTTFSLFHSFGVEKERPFADMNANTPVCSSISNGTICCDRSSIRSDICIMNGDVRTHPASSSVFLYIARDSDGVINYGEEEGYEELKLERIRPYTRKWETSVMGSIGELNLIAKKVNHGIKHHCDVWHDVPAVFFSTGGYTGNLYHEFNDGILPLYITSQHLNKKVVFVILEYHDWWILKYGDVLSQLSDYPAINFSGDNRTHCFPEAIVGLRIHDELTVDSSLMEGKKSINDFQNLLDQAYWPRIRGLIQDEEREAQEKLEQKLSLSPTSETWIVMEREVEEEQLEKPKLVILSRNGSREITNQNLLVKMAEEIGFQVEELMPVRTSELARIYRVLNSSDVMVGVHGAALTHFLYMRPGSVFIQIIPLGTAWAAETYFGEPVRKLGLKYIGYEIITEESSLYDKYDKGDPVLRDPDSVNEKGWQYTKSIYLEDQNVRLDLRRFRKQLVRAYDHIAKMKGHVHLQPW